MCLLSNRTASRANKMVFYWNIICSWCRNEKFHRGHLHFSTLASETARIRNGFEMEFENSAVWKAIKKLKNFLHWVMSWNNLVNYFTISDFYRLTKSFSINFWYKNGNEIDADLLFWLLMGKDVIRSATQITQNGFD